MLFRSVGYIDERGEVAVPGGYRFVSLFREGLAPVSRDGKWGFIDRRGRAVIPLQFELAEPFDGGLARVHRGGAAGYISRGGAWVWRPSR